MINLRCKIAIKYILEELATFCDAFFILYDFSFPWLFADEFLAVCERNLCYNISDNRVPLHVRLVQIDSFEFGRLLSQQYKSLFPG